MTERFYIARRALLGLLAGAFGALVAACWGPSEEPSEEPAVSSDGELLEIVADVLLPGDGVLPAASTIRIAECFEAYLSTRASLARRHTQAWPLLRAGLEAGTAEGVGATVTAWYDELRTGPAPSVEAKHFESLRRDLLRVYYSDPRVQHLLGYTGPAVVHGV